MEELPIQRFAESLGLPGAPKIKFLNKEIAKRKKNASHIAANSESTSAPPKAHVSAESDSADDSDAVSDEGPSSGEEEIVPEVKADAMSRADKVSSSDAHGHGKLTGP